MVNTLFHSLALCGAVLFMPACCTEVYRRVFIFSEKFFKIPRIRKQAVNIGQVY